MEHGRWFLINAVVRPGRVASSSLRSSARRRVDADGEHMIWWMWQAYSAVEDVASMLVANAMVDGVLMGTWLVVAGGIAAWLPAFLVRSTIHNPVLPQIMMRPW